MVFLLLGWHRGWRHEWEPPGTLSRARLHQVGPQRPRPSPRVPVNRGPWGWEEASLSPSQASPGNAAALGLPAVTAGFARHASGPSASLMLFSLPITEGPPCQDPRGQDRQLQCLSAQQAQRTPHGGTGADGRHLEGLAVGMEGDRLLSSSWGHHHLRGPV